jgi:predicted transcriptional regulator
MNHIPCQGMIWTGLPTIKKEIAKSIVNTFGLNQKDAARLLGITPAAICQYLSNKRGKIEISDKKIKVEIRISAKRIIQKGEPVVHAEICRICKLIRSNTNLIFE